MDSWDQKYKIHRILLVDDEVAICRSMEAFLEDYGYDISIAHNGKEGLEKFNANLPDLVILDLQMPVMTGHEFLAELAATHPEVPKIIISGIGDVGEAMQTVDEGGWDFISKPIHDLNFLIHKIKLLEEKATLVRQNRLYKKHLEALVEKKTEVIQQLNRQLIDTQKEIVAKLGDVIETRSRETGNHVRRVAYVSRLLALAYGLEPIETEIIRMASPLHDVGKIGISDAILNKCGKLTDAEFEEIKTHSDIGYNMLKDSTQPILKAGAIIAKQHHERWDGSGYPNGLRGEDIHIYGRITCLADVYDALRQKRHYKEAWSRDLALSYIKEQSGTIFEPKLVELFLQNILEIEKTIHTYQQPEAVI